MELKPHWQSDKWAEVSCPVCGSSNVEYDAATDTWRCGTSADHVSDCYAQFRIVLQPLDLPHWWKDYDRLMSEYGEE